VGQRVSYYPKIINRIVNEDHELGNHSWEHKNFLSIDSNAVRRSLNKTHKLVLKTTGKKMKLVRPPYGAFNNRIRRIAQNELGYKIIMWDVDPLDWKKPGTIKVRNRIVNGAHSGSIILAHDIHTSTVNAIPTVIDRLKAKGYQFVTVSRLLRESQFSSGDSTIQVVSL
jgi:peptidoglycan/xylan/chitin deacetylase (PgdA/CDA1 family)